MEGKIMVTRREFRDVKVGLSRRDESLFDVNLTKLYGDGGVTTLVVKRSEFEDAISEPADLTMEITRKAIEGAGISPTGLDLIILAGNTTRIPLIESRISGEYSAKRVRAGDTDVARGAAVFGGQLGEADWKRQEMTV